MRRPSLPPKPRRAAERPAGRLGQRPRRPAVPPAASAPPPVGHDRDVVPVCGLAAVLALFARDPRRVERLFFEPRFAADLTDARRALAAARKPYREVETEELARVAGTIRHGGVVAVARPRPVLPFEPKLAADWARDRKPLLILDGIGNPHNLGAIIRSAAYFGIGRVLLAERPEQALPSPASYRIAEGALEYVGLYRAKLADALPALAQTYRVIGTALERGVPVGELRGGRPIALVLGNEETGVDAATLALCDAVVTIPGHGGPVQSLNVAAAAAVLFYALASN